MTCIEIISLAGLLLNMGGVVIVWIYGFPQPRFNEYVAISVEDATPMLDGRTAKDHADDARREKRKYRFRSNVGMSIILLGFMLQAFSIVLQ